MKYFFPYNLFELKDNVSLLKALLYFLSYFLKPLNYKLPGKV